MAIIVKSGSPTLFKAIADMEKDQTEDILKFTQRWIV